MDPLKDDWHTTGGIPKSVAVHGRCATGGTPAGVTRQMALDDEGKVLISGDINVNNTFADPVPTDETLYDSISTDLIEVPYLDGVTGEQALPSDTCRGFLLMAARTNTSSVFVGSASDKCHIEMPPGARKDYALADPSVLFVLNVDTTAVPGPLSQYLAIEKYY